CARVDTSTLDATAADYW
nr:immunoglobulin heavy chain junction region [Macaca mulatta]MOX62387.1 immunoglobulin heavy chain junction region [Macaca mulatta]MOX64488.1 immunoglobulin heavy chain junction region [Macaca mulatta]MOX65115.1 immunoglobulin heavy chain junction region [Macaca mulatta]MOX67057.1 immunoglobulin heavy chain junction region [Macaca mulatta]